MIARAIFRTALALCGALSGVLACGTTEKILTTNTTDPGAGDMDTDSVTGDDTLWDPGTGSDTDTDIAPDSDVATDRDTALPADTSGTEPNDTGTDSGSDARDCSNEETEPESVVIIGDAWIQYAVPHLESLARKDGALGPDAHYTDLSMPGQDLSSIRMQYASRATGETPIRVLIMDGGGIDLINGTPVDAVVGNFEQHLDQVAGDGAVQHVIYLLYPSGGDTPNVEEAGPGLRAACSEGTEPLCHFVDLSDVWTDDYYGFGGRLLPSPDVGAAVIAKEIWATMQESCIAQ